MITIPDLRVGQQVFTRTAQPSNLDCFLVGAAYWTSHRIHYDRTWAEQEGYVDVVVPGVLLYGWLERLVVEWAGGPQAVKSYRFRHTGFPTVADELVFTGTVTDVAHNGKAATVSLKLDVHTIDDRSVLAGEATVQFHSS